MREFKETFPGTAMEALKHIPPTVYRQQWGALPALEEPSMLMPVPYVRLTYTGGEECYSKESCEILVKAMQRSDMENRKLPDIQYSFLIGSDGTLFEGVGWHIKSTIEQDFIGLSGKCVDIAYIGDFKNKDPPEIAVKTANNFISYMAKTGYLTKDFETVTLESSREKKK